jgi:hypothetical protein
MKLSELQSSNQFDTEKVSKCISELEQVLAKHDMNVGELLLTYGNLGYKLGANLRKACYDASFVSEPPDTEKLNELYYTDFTEDVALMLTGLTVTSWVDELLKDNT